MDDLLIRSGELLPPSLSNEKAVGEKQPEGKNFSSILRDTIDDINKLQLNADKTITNLELNNTASIHEAMIALEKADISFRAMMQVRNKILDAYQEIMRLQV